MTMQSLTLRVPTGIVSNEDGLNEATGYVEVPVVVDPTMTLRGEVRRGHSGQVIALREWDEQVLLHEALHVALGWVQPPLSPGQEHPVVCRVEVALWEMGWRLHARDAEVRRAVEGLRALADTWSSCWCGDDIVRDCPLHGYAENRVLAERFVADLRALAESESACLRGCLYHRRHPGACCTCGHADDAGVDHEPGCPRAALAEIEEGSP